MKKRSVLMTVLAMILVAVISVGSTLAYLTATDKEVVNTFHFADMTVTITEPTPSVPPQVTVSPKPSDGGFDYTNVLPNQALGKNPQITTDTDVDAYLFIKVSGASDLVMPCLDKDGKAGNPITTNHGWTAAPSPAPAVDGNFNGIYYREIKVGTMTPNENGVYGPFDVFQYVKVADKDVITSLDDEGKVVTKVVENNGTTTTEKTIDLNEIKVEVFEIQAAEINLDTATQKAVEYFNSKAPAAGSGATGA